MLDKTIKKWNEDGGPGDIFIIYCDNARTVQNKFHTVSELPEVKRRSALNRSFIMENGGTIYLLSSGQADRLRGIYVADYCTRGIHKNIPDYDMEVLNERCLRHPLNREESNVR